MKCVTEGSTGQIISRSPQGERGLKFFGLRLVFLIARRSPQGERGLKSKLARIAPKERSVAPRKGSAD